MALVRYSFEVQLKSSKTLYKRGERAWKGENVKQLLNRTRLVVVVVVANYLWRRHANVVLSFARPRRCFEMRLQCGCPGTEHFCMHDARGLKLETRGKSDERDESGRSGRPRRDGSSYLYGSCVFEVQLGCQLAGDPFQLPSGTAKKECFLRGSKTTQTMGSKKSQEVSQKNLQT